MSENKMINRYDDTEQIEKMAQKRRMQQRAYRRKMMRRRQMLIRLAVIGAVALLIIGVVISLLVRHAKKKEQEAMQAAHVTLYNDVQPELNVQLLDINDYSRPGIALDEVNGIVVHYTANPGTTAMQNRDYFNGLADSKKTKASAHFIIGLEGEIVQCIPCNEIAYASNNRNYDTVSIECCIADDTGKFNEKTYDSLVRLVTWLMGRYDLGPDEVIRHYDVTGKACPKYYVENETAWDTFKEDLETYILENGVEKELDNPL